MRRGSVRRGAVALVTVMAAVAAGSATAAAAGHVVARGIALPSDLAWGDDGLLYVTDHLRASISSVTLGTAAAPGTATSIYQDPLTGEPAGAPQSPFTSVGAVAFDQGGNAWVADDGAKGGGRLWEIPADPATRHPLAAEAAPVTALTDPGGSSLRPGALAVDGRNTLYVAMGRSGEIAAVTGLGSPSPAVQRGFAATPSGRAAGGLAIDGQDRLLMTDGADVYAVSLAPGASRAPRLLLRGAPVSPTVGLSAPTDMVVAPDALYVVDNGGAQVVRVPMAGGAPSPGAATVQMSGLSNADGLAADQAGRVRAGVAGIPDVTLLAGADPSGGNAAVGTISSLDEPLTAPGLRVPPAPAPPASGGGPAATGPAGGKPAVVTVAAVELLPRTTAAPAFPRLRRSATSFRPAGRQTFAVTFRLRRTARVTMTIRTRRGTLVRRIVAGRHRRGSVVRLRWDGRDRSGRIVRAGTYRFTVTSSARDYRETSRGSVRVLR